MNYTTTSEMRHLDKFGSYTILFAVRYCILIPCSYLLLKTALTAYHVITALSEISKSRCVAHPDAYHALSQRLQDKRVYRTFSYDVYLPPLAVDSCHASATKDYILFLPGAYVDPVAYAQPASLFSDAGFVVVVVSGEPLGIVDTLLPRFSPSNLHSIQRAVEERFGNNTSNRESRWILMGHSMGSLACTKLAPKFPGIKEVVLWGSVPFLNYVENISHLDHQIRVFVVQASKDIILQMFGTPESIQEFWNRLPKSTIRFDIIDGTHAGFGNYISSFIKDPDGCIGATTQQVIAVEETLKFLNA